jgi:signal transduction histidine kinase
VVAITAIVVSVDQHPAFGSDSHAPTPAVVVDVTDDGPGVPAELIDRIFDPFFSTKPQGYGLGLPIVRKIVDAHDGRIDLMAMPEGGTRFRVTLPVSSATSWFK